MSKSISFVENIIDFHELSNDYKITEFPIDTFIALETFPIRNMIKSDATDLIINYNPNINYDYYVINSVIHDGTLLFDLECIEKSINKALSYPMPSMIKEYNKNKMIIWTICNSVLVTEYGEQFSTKEKPWIRSRATAIVPFSFNIIKKGFRR